MNYLLITIFFFEKKGSHLTRKMFGLNLKLVTNEFVTQSLKHQKVPSTYSQRRHFHKDER